MFAEYTTAVGHHVWLINVLFLIFNTWTQLKMFACFFLKSNEIKLTLPSPDLWNENSLFFQKFLLISVFIILAYFFCFHLAFISGWHSPVRFINMKISHPLGPYLFCSACHAGEGPMKRHTDADAWGRLTQPRASCNVSWKVLKDHWLVWRQRSWRGEWGRRQASADAFIFAFYFPSSSIFLLSSVAGR